MKRWLLLLYLFACSLAVFAACNPPGTPTPTTSRTVTPARPIDIVNGFDVRNSDSLD